MVDILDPKGGKGPKIFIAYSINPIAKFKLAR